MSTTVLRHCDRCKKEIPEKDKGQIWIVQILFINEEDFTSRNNSALRLHEKTNPLRQEWCRPCADELGLFRRAWQPSAEQPIAPAPTFEDQLREIIRCEIDEARET